MRIVLIRHPTPLIEPGICYGRLDVPLHPSAEQQIDRLAISPNLAGTARVWSSPARRCLALAEAIVLAHGLPLTVDRRLQELDFGAWEGRSWDAIGRAELDRWAACPLLFAAPDGESGAELIARVRDFHAELRRDQADCVVVSHGGPLKLLTAMILGHPVDLLAPAPVVGSLRVVTWSAT